MASHFQAASLVASPSYPNSIAWSEENLVAVASGHIITILNPASLDGPRGMITLPSSNPFSIGVVKRENLLTACLMPTCLSRDIRPCARSISWSQPGLAPNSGCLLAVCTTEGRVKLYRSPFCEFSAEWVEVADISNMLYDYFVNINFEEVDSCPSPLFDEETIDGHLIESGCTSDLQNTISCRRSKRKKAMTSKMIIDNMDDVAEELMYGENGNSSHQDPNGVVEIKSENFIESNLHQSFPVCKSEQKQFKRSRENYGLKSITPEQYASRSAMLSSLVVAWSPALHLSSESGPASLCDSCHCGVLAVGGKSGKISFWRVPEPQCYSIEHGDVSVDSFLTGLLQAHNAWITAITWGVITFDSSKVFLATGSADGSVKIWLGDAMGLIKSSGIENASFSQLEEVITTGSPVSALSLSVPVESPDKILLAVGKGSGLLEAWIFQVSSSELQNVGSYIQHDKVVTGLSWAFDGRCLYSCSQDNSVRSWILRGSALHEVPFPSSSPCFEGSNDIPHAFDSCFGVTLSPGNLAAAVVRSFDVDLLDQMYEARTQKAAVQFFWTGGQQLEASSEKKLDENTESLPNISNSDLAYWEFNILWSLKLFENVCRPLVVWDVITALSAFKQSAPNCLQLMLFKWLSSLYLHCYPDLSTKNILLVAPSLLSKIESRKMHLLNIVCRRVVLAEVKADRLNGKQHDVESNEQLKPWIQLLLSSETELRVRIVVFTLLMVLSRASCSTKMPSISIHWHPSGVAQMEQWVAIHHGPVQDQLKLLKSKIGELGGRLNSICDYVTEEKCNFCSASVPFESPELAFCEGAECAQSHKLSRCMVCMKVCPTTPLWFCMCCQRRAFKLAPQVFFTMSRSPLDVRTYNWVSELQVKPKPLCPFCGVVLQRLLPEFLLSTSLV